MTDYQKYINALRKCAKEHENDRTSTGYIIVADLCRDTANLLEELEQEPILNRLRAEILEEMLSHSGTGEEVIQAYADGLKKGLNILDKYKTESEVEDGNDD